MTTPSQRRRRLGALFVSASVLLVPLTASISYAQDETVEVDVTAPPLAPRAPDAPLTAVEPTPPLAPVAPEAGPDRIIVDEIDGDHTRDHFVIVDKSAPDGHHAALKPGRKFRVIRAGKDGKLSDKQIKELEALELRLDHLGEELDRNVVIRREDIERLTAESGRLARFAVATSPTVIMNCDGNEDVSDTRSSDGKRVIRICRQRIDGHAVGGLRAARAQIARQREMSEETRKEVLERLDSEIARLEAAN